MMIIMIVRTIDMCKKKKPLKTFVIKYIFEIYNL